ncbi:MAG: filamentous hemagglutinin N-terminal domain-containing protein [Phormidesmis sp.]
MLIGILIFLSGFGAQRPALSQVETDGTFSTDVRSSDGLDFVIEAGEVAGENLFHSFELFSVPTGGSAYFNQSADIQTILSRVTGGTLSSIDGEIRANGSANVFLINPEGIVFGPAATLSIGGSFVGTTAQSVRFEDGTVLESDRAMNLPQLTISRPIGLQLTEESGSIAVSGNLGNTTTQVGQDLALVGNGVTFAGAAINRGGGRIEIGSVSRGDVDISGIDVASPFVASPFVASPLFSYGGVESFADVLIDATGMSVSGPAGGSLQVQGQQVTLSGGSSLFSISDRPVSDPPEAQQPFLPTENQVLIEAQQISVFESSQLGSFTGGVGFGNDVVLRAETIELGGTDPLVESEGGFVLSLVGDTATDATGGNILIDAGTLNVFEGAAIETELAGAGKGGDIIVRAESVQLQGPDASRGTFIPAEISTVALPTASGQVGDIVMVTGSLLLNENGFLASNTTGQADVGDVDITADDVTISTLSLLYTVPDPGTTGQAGNINIEAGELAVLNGSEISSNAAGTGNAGDVTIQSETVTVDGAASFLGFFDVQSAILAGVNPGGAADGGNVSIVTDRLALNDGGVVANDIQGIEGNAGRIDIEASEVVLSKESIISAASVGFADSGVSGRAGDIDIETTTLDILSNSVISSNTFGDGNAGNIRVLAEDITIIGSEQFPDVFDLSGIVATVEPSATGNGGNIIVETDRLTLRERGLISSQHEGQGRAGNVEITADEILLINQGVISSRVLESGVGQAGNIDIEAADTLRIYNGSQVLANTDGVGDGGDINIQAAAVDIQQTTFFNDTLVVSSVSSEVGATGTGDSGDIVVMADRLNVSDSAAIRNRTAGEGNAGTIEINARQVELSTPQLENVSGLSEAPSANIASDSVSSGSAGNVSIVADEFTAREGGNVTVSSSGTGSSGNLSLTGRVIKLVDGGELTAESSAGDRGSIDVQNGDLLLLSNDARITTNATGAATGGNVLIEGGLVVLNEESQIVARAIEGDGGDITIRPIQLLPSNDSVISASSELGVDGTVKIERITTDESGVDELDNDVLNPDQLVADSCLAAGDRRSGQFLISGAGGLAATPTEPGLSGFETYEIPPVDSVAGNGELRDEAAGEAAGLNAAGEGASVVEAGGFHRLESGQMVLARRCS